MDQGRYHGGQLGGGGGGNTHFLLGRISRVVFSKTKLIVVEKFKFL